jgi:transposase-like protein
MEAALKLVYLVIRNVEKKWTRQPQLWTRALNQFDIHFEARLPA